MARTHESTPGHVRIHRRCGACASLFNANEQVVALVGDDNGTLKETIGPFPYGKQMNVNNHPDYPHRACYWWCRSCRHGVSTETATVHRDCQVLFVRHCNIKHKLRYLLELSTWQYPWRNATCIERLEIYHLERVRQSAERICNLPILSAQPPEIREHIWNYAQGNCFERYGAVLNLVEDMSDASLATHSLAASLRDIYAWSRGGQPVVQQDIKDPIIRMSIDARGIFRIERLSIMPPKTRFRSEGLVYIVERVDRLSETMARFLFGFCRLEFRNGPPPDLYQWDTPSPPPLKSFSLYPIPHCPVSSPRDAEIPKDCTGITFLMDLYRLESFHIHTPSKPCAKSTFGGSKCQDTDLWIYVPCQGGTKSFGVRRNTHGDESFHECILLCLNRGGRVLIGKQGHYETYIDILMSSSPSSIIYHDFQPQGSGVSHQILGCYSDHATEVPWSFPSPNSTATTNADPKLYFSSASLANVASTETFHDPEEGSCKGIIIRYEDGVERALGQCRIGVDPSTVCIDPKQIWYKGVIPPENGFRAKVEFSPLMNGPSKEGWQRAGMGLELHCWFDEDTMIVKLLP